MTSVRSTGWTARRAILSLPLRVVTAALLLLAAGLALAAPSCSTLLDHKLRPLAGKESLRLCEQYGGKVLLLVNTASKCGFTPQYEGLEALHQKLSGRGFAVLGFPSNDFMGQEPGSEQQIAEFCTLTYGVKFPMFQKTRVSGPKAHAMYRQLAAETGEEPGWNFHKYLVGRDGQVIASFPSKVKPDDPALLAAIEKALAAD